MLLVTACGSAAAPAVRNGTSGGEKNASTSTDAPALPCIFPAMLGGHNVLGLAAIVTGMLGCSGEPKGAATGPAQPQAVQPDPTPLYRNASVAVVRMPGVGEDGLVSISPSGAARLYRKGEPIPDDEGLVEATWCLHRDEVAPVCLQAGTSQPRCLGGSNPVGWRPDEKAVVLCGERETRSVGGSSFDAWDSVLDFDTGRVVQFDPHEGPMVTPIWSRDGRRIFAFTPDGKPHRPWHDSARKPVSLAPFENPPSTRRVNEDDFGPVWSTGYRVPGVMLFEPPAMARHLVDVTKATQDIVDVTPDGRFAIAEDGKVDLGHEGAPWHIVELETKKASPLGIPPGFSDGRHAELSDGGHRVLALWGGDGGKLHLGITADRGANWHVLHSWESADADAPDRFVSDGEMQWNGGPTAWIIAKSDAALRVDLAE